LLGDLSGRLLALLDGRGGLDHGWGRWKGLGGVGASRSGGRKGRSRRRAADIDCCCCGCGGRTWGKPVPGSPSARRGARQDQATGSHRAV
jgi:hypothetical protein